MRLAGRVSPPLAVNHKQFLCFSLESRSIAMGGSPVETASN
jgi:hypothetical protein